MGKRVHLQYGKTGLPVELPGDNLHVIEPTFLPGLPDPAAAFAEAARRPIGGGPPLRDRIAAHERVAVVIPDGTRALPSQRLLPWLFAELAHVPRERVVIVNGTGSHRANTREELIGMVGEAIVDGYRIVNHDAHDPATHALAGTDREGRAVHFNREYVEADRRIVLGFIEPHFMAGFSGGYKGVFPAVAAIDAILHYHRASVIGDPRSTWGVLDGNPTQDQIRDKGSLLPVDFLVNVTLNRKHEITRFFCGDVLPAHAAGCAFAKQTAMVACAEAFPIVITTNSGFPLDQNLYQTVKGMSAANQIAADGGLILAASRCNDGFPAHGNFRKLLWDHATPQAILDTIEAPGFQMFDQWQAQLLALIARRVRVGLHSELPAEEVRRAHLEPVADLAARVQAELDRVGADAPVAVMPEGPQTIPYLTGARA